LKKRFEVSILGRELSVISDSGDERVASVIRYVNGKLGEAEKTAGKNALDIAILAALNIADEYLQIMEATGDIHDQLENKAEQLIDLINDRK
jgi:cell division protein ZapA (FtsZ GTPase activity inhibitor)